MEKSKTNGVMMVVITMVVVLLWCCEVIRCSTVTYDRKAIIIDGRPRILISGSIHYPRSTPDMWQDLVQKAKDGGVDVIDTYVFWNLHEPSPAKYDFQGRYDLVQFIKIVQKVGLYVHLRIGPYVCAEWNFGGFPVWLKFVPGISFRTDNAPFKNAMQGFTGKIVQMMKNENLYASQGGPIILSQIENEYGGQSKTVTGQSYIKWAAQMALGLNTGVPWVMCKQDDAPDPVINACNGFYCDWFTPNKAYKPTMWTEAWTGWFTEFGGAYHQRPVQDLAFAVARFIQKGGSFVNYYMYHGGTNFGRTAGGPYITTSYDYDAPLDEYGLIRQPKYGHLKELHKAIKLCENALVSSDPVVSSLGSYQQAAMVIVRLFLSNFHSSSTARVLFNNMHYDLPPWSISILPDCRNVIFNTAKVGVQSSRMQMLPTTSPLLSWEKYDEDISFLEDTTTWSTTGLLEQLNVTRDTSDYLWYITSVNIGPSESFLRGGQKPTLDIESKGHAVHVYINGQFSGSAYGTREYPSLKYSGPVNFRAGINKIALLSISVGLTNVGIHFETWKTGIVGPVYLTGLDKGKWDLSWNKWFYKVGLRGEATSLISLNGDKPVDWVQGSLAAASPKQPLTWYKAYFDAPQGNEPLALDMFGMGKGEIWVNGESLGRYWLTYAKGECSVCNYAGTYRPPKCQLGCGHPTQRWYHVPRCWLKPTKNLLLVFEELGGDESRIALVKRSVYTNCSEAFENHPTAENYKIHGGLIMVDQPKVDLQCAPGQYISAINFASFGTPYGTCGSLVEGKCHSPNSHTLIEKKCLGREACSVGVSNNYFGNDPCPKVLKRLTIEASCSSSSSSSSTKKTTTSQQN